MSFSEDFIAAYESAARSRVEAADWKHRAETAEARVAELEAQNARLREALEEIARYDRGSPHGDGVCPFGCDTPYIAKQALADTKGTP